MLLATPKQLSDFIPSPLGDDAIYDVLRPNF